MPGVRFYAIKPHPDRFVKRPGLFIVCGSAKPKTPRHRRLRMAKKGGHAIDAFGTSVIHGAPLARLMLNEERT